MIKDNLLKKSLEMFADTAEKRDAFLKFVVQFGKCLKYPRGDHNILAVRQEKYFVDPYRCFHTVFGVTQLGSITLLPPQLDLSGSCLKEYVERMKEDQKDIFYIRGKSITKVTSSPFLFMVDPVDEYAAQQSKEFDGNKLKSTTK